MLLPVATAPSTMKLFSLCVVTTLFLSARSAPQQSVYDQKQTGEWNIQVHLKDFQIIALLGDEAFGDYDYNYDYADFTVKPPNNTTSSNFSTSTETPTSSSTSTSSTSTTTTKPEPEKGSTDKVEAQFSTSAPDRIKVQIIDETSPNIGDVTPSNAAALGEVLHYKRCATGYSRDKRGRCRRVRRPPPQFDIGRLASSLAARFRGAPDDDLSSK